MISFSNNGRWTSVQLKGAPRKRGTLAALAQREASHQLGHRACAARKVVLRGEIEVLVDAVPTMAQCATSGTMITRRFGGQALTFAETASRASGVPTSAQLCK